MPNIRHQLEIQAPLSHVFDLLTLPDGLNNWWTLECTGTPELGAEYRLYFGPEYDWRAVVSHVLPGEAITWSIVDAMDDWLPTQFGFELEQTAKGCTLRFFHLNWQEESDHFAITTYCWAQLLRGLKDLAETGTIVPFECRN
ncbi:MAG: SRPBCC domain-containing protein [Pirellulaceae bacterium]